MDPRRSFLTRLEPLFRRHAPNAAFRYEESSVFPEMCLSIHVPGRRDHLLVTAVSLVGNTKHYDDPFPGAGRPHWEIWERDEQGQLGERAISCRVESIISAFEAWLARGSAVPPLQGPPAPTAHLEALAAAVKDQWDAENLAASTDALSEQEHRRLLRDVECLALSRVCHLFPRDDEGHPVRKTAILLQSYGPDVSRGRKQWLHVVAAGPKRAPKLTIAVAPLIGENYEHRWDALRWMWDARERAPKPEHRWGIPRGATADVDRCLESLDDGRIGEALELFHVGWTPEVAKVLAGQPLSMNDGQLTERWAAAIHRALTELAPWKLEVAAKRKPLRLLTLPGQRHQRKASLMLGRIGGATTLMIEYSGTNARLPAVHWKRTPWHDLVRRGLISAALSDASHRTPIVRPSPKVDEDAIAKKLIDTLTSTSPSRYDACLRLGKQMSSSRAAEALEPGLRSPESDLRRLTLELASALRLGGMAPAAMQALHDDAPEVRRAATVLLRRVRYEPALDVVAEQVLQDPSFFLDGAATLRGWGDKVGVASFQSLLASENPSVRAAVCLSLIQYGGKTLAPTLVELARGDLPVVAGAALHALASLDDDLQGEAATHVNARADASEVVELTRWFRGYRKI